MNLAASLLSEFHPTYSPGFSVKRLHRPGGCPLKKQMVLENSLEYTYSTFGSDTCPPTPLRYGDAAQWRPVPGEPHLHCVPGRFTNPCKKSIYAYRTGVIQAVKLKCS